MESYAAGDTKLEDLPEDVVCRIISCLSMRDAARASASCSAFLLAWARYPHLTFDEDTLRLRRDPPAATPQDAALPLQQQDDLARRFVRRVDAVMSRRQSRGAAALDALIIRFDYLLRHDAPCVNRWVSLALASATTRRLRLDFLPQGIYSPGRLEYDFGFPCSLLSAGTPAAAALEHLYFRLGSLRAPKPELTNLVTLVLSQVRVTGEALGQLLSSCHKLQSLKLKRCEELDYVDVSSFGRLRSLLVSSCWSMRKVDISGSAMESLRLDGRHMPESLLSGSVLLRPAVKVTSARIDLRYLIEPAKSEATADTSRLQLLSLAQLMPGLESLSLTLVWDTKVIMTSPNNSGNIFRYLKQVDIEFYMLKLQADGRDDFLFLYPFLDAAPALETLSLDVSTLSWLLLFLTAIGVFCLLLVLLILSTNNVFVAFV